MKTLSQSGVAKSKMKPLILKNAVFFNYFRVPLQLVSGFWNPVHRNDFFSWARLKRSFNAIVLLLALSISVGSLESRAHEKHLNAEQINDLLDAIFWNYNSIKAMPGDDWIEFVSQDHQRYRVSIDALSKTTVEALVKLERLYGDHKGHSHTAQIDNREIDRWNKDVEFEERVFGPSENQKKLDPIPEKKRIQKLKEKVHKTLMSFKFLIVNLSGKTAEMMKETGRIPGALLGFGLTANVVAFEIIETMTALHILCSLNFTLVPAFWFGVAALYTNFEDTIRTLKKAKGNPYRRSITLLERIRGNRFLRKTIKRAHIPFSDEHGLLMNQKDFKRIQLRSLPSEFKEAAKFGFWAEWAMARQRFRHPRTEEKVNSDPVHTRRLTRIDTFKRVSALEYSLRLLQSRAFANYKKGQLKWSSYLKESWKIGYYLRRLHQIGFDGTFLSLPNNNQSENQSMRKRALWDAHYEKLLLEIRMEWKLGPLEGAGDELTYWRRQIAELSQEVTAGLTCAQTVDAH